MRYLKFNKGLIIISIIIGFVLALAIRLSPVVFTSDCHKVYRSPRLPMQEEINKESLGKEVFGMGGFPFSSYEYCVVIHLGYEKNNFFPRCEKYSIYGEGAILLNSIFWGIIIYIILLAAKKSDEYLKPFLDKLKSAR